MDGEAVAPLDEGAKTTISELPNELLLNIWSYLDAWDSEPPSISNFNQEPSDGLTSSEQKALKTLSLVCKRWRTLMLPELFRYTRIKLDEESRWVEVKYSLLENLTDRLQPLSLHEQHVLEVLRISFDKLALSSKSKEPIASDDLIGVELINGDDQVFRSLPESCRCWMPSTCSIEEFVKFVECNNLQRKVHGLVVYTDRAYPENPSEQLTNRMNLEHEAFWKQLLDVLNPYRIVLAAPPSTMAVLTDGRLSTDDTREFGQDLHYLEFKQERSRSLDTPAYSDQTGTTFKYHRCLHNLRKWNHLGYNEGSYLPAYNTYEFFNKKPPMILPFLLIWLRKEARYTPPTLESFSYRGIFPFSSHIDMIMSELLSSDKIEHLKLIELSFAPDPQSTILQDPQRVLRVDLNDCWSEFERAYRIVASSVRKRKTRGGLRIMSHDYGNEALGQTLDKSFAVLYSTGWVKEGFSCVAHNG